MSQIERLYDIGLRTGTDKARHGYLDFYEEHIDRTAVRSLLEIGIFQGASLAMWREWLPEATIEGWDIKNIEVDGCITKVVNQDDRDRMLSTAADFYDLIIDDAGHRMRGQQTALSALFPRCRMFIMEDLHTSWIPKYFGPDDCSTYDLIVNIESDGWPSKWATSEEAEYIAQNARLVDVFVREGKERPSSATAILLNRAYE